MRVGALIRAALFLPGMGAEFQAASIDPLVGKPGQTAAIPSWYLKSSASIRDPLATLSRVGLNTSSWHHIQSSKCTLMGCLIEAGVYNETELFYSDNLRGVDEKQFRVPWIYRAEFSLTPSAGKRFLLQTHGISSKADIFLNGKPVATSTEQAGSYVGRSDDITALVHTTNALAIRVYPTDYFRDLAIGWVDWNPWPADNGTGVWRDVEIKETGPVMLEPLRVVTQLGTPVDAHPAKVTLKARARNLENTAVTVTAAGHVALLSGGRGVSWSETLTLPPLSDSDIVLDAIVDRPAIWWPRQWGDQPLYQASIAVTVTTRDGGGAALSDRTTAEFGFRTVASRLNAHNDTVFSINGHPLQVIGAGYAPDMFLRWDGARWAAELRYLLDMGFNTVRLEGKGEHPALYSAADRAGVLVVAGWECCDRWEAWPYNPDLPAASPPWTDADYAAAHASARHEAAMLQSHPCVLAFLLGSDYWPDERATGLYLSAFGALDWQAPLLGSASARGFDPRTGPSGLKMDGPYDWVPPGYWFDDGGHDGGHARPSPRLGAAAGFASELSAGAGTPGLSSLRRFLSPRDLDGLWREPDRPLFHMSREGSQFDTRRIFNAALRHRWGPPRSLEDYLAKTQLMDYEAVRAQVGAYAAMWSNQGGTTGGSDGDDGGGGGGGDQEPHRPATGMIYWMANNAWPGLHWNLWDYYLRPAGAYFGAKAAAAGRGGESVVFDYVRRAVWVVNRSLRRRGSRTVAAEILTRDGRVVFTRTVNTVTTSNASKMVASLTEALKNATADVVFLRLVLADEHGRALSRNVYWLAKEPDALDWDRSEWYYTPVTSYTDYTALNALAPATVAVVARREGRGAVHVVLENQSDVPAFFVSLSLVDDRGEDVLPLTWEDNYVTLWPKERMELSARAVGRGRWEPAAVIVEGKNVKGTTVRLAGCKRI